MEFPPPSLRFLFEKGEKGNRASRSCLKGTNNSVRLNFGGRCRTSLRMTCRIMHDSLLSNCEALRCSLQEMTGTDKVLIDLLKGWPNPSLLPVARIKAASSRALSKAEVFTPGLLYGPDPGYEPLREDIARWLTEFYQPPMPVFAERICITGGASQNIASILQVFSDPLYTTNVWMVSPTYFRACRIFEDAGFYGRLRSVPEDEEGLDIAYLSRELKRSEDNAKAESNTRLV